MIPRLLLVVVVVGAGGAGGVLGSMDSNYNRKHRMRSKRSGQLKEPMDPNYMFPVPEIKNVYQAWKPIDYGHPLVDATIHYAPPELERVHIGRGPVPARPPQTNKNLVFEAAREVDGLKNKKLRASVYVSPGRDKPYKGLVPRDTVVTIPSQRRNSIIHQDQRHGRTEGTRKIDHLKSGIYYVDDPYEKYREKPKQRQRPNVAGYPFFGADRFFDRADDIRDYQSDEPSSRIDLDVDEGVRYIPVSLLSTPPTITTTNRPYGEIVNKDFYDLSTGARRKPKPEAPKSGRKVATSSTNTLYPLGNPNYGSNSNARPQYFPDQAPVSNSRPPRLEGVLGPRRPQLKETQRHIVNYAATSSWAPSNHKYHGKGREIEYRKEPIIYQVKDSGELVNPNNGHPHIENDYDQASSGSYHWTGNGEPQEKLSSLPRARDFNATESDSGDLEPEAYPVAALQDTASKSELKGTTDDLFARGQLASSPAGPGGYDTQVGEGGYQGEISARSVDEELTHSGYSPAQIYYLCTTEVPQYLQRDLCKLPQSLRNDRSNTETSFSDRSDNNVLHTELIDQTRVPHTALIDERHGTPSLSSSSTFPSKQGSSGQATFPRNHGSPTFFRAGTHVIETQTAAYDSSMTSLRTVSVRLPPKTQFQFVQDNQYVSTTEPMLQERTQPQQIQENNQDTFADQGQLQSSPETPFPYVKGPTDGGPAPIIYSVAQSKVAVYRPNELTTTIEPPTSSSPTEPVSSSTAKPFHYQAPLTNPPIYPANQEYNQYPPKPQTPPHFGKHPPVLRKRPLIYAKRRPEGPAQVSRPFEYLSRLSHFLSDRVFTGRTKLRKKSGEYPTLVTRRLEGSVS